MEFYTGANQNLIPPFLIYMPANNVIVLWFNQWKTVVGHTEECSSKSPCLLQLNSWACFFVWFFVFYLVTCFVLRVEYNFCTLQIKTLFILFYFYMFHLTIKFYFESSIMLKSMWNQNLRPTNYLFICLRDWLHLFTQKFPFCC